MLLSMTLLVLADPVGVGKDARCAAVMLALRDSLAEAKREGEAATTEAAASYYIGRVEAYFEAQPAAPGGFAPKMPGSHTRTAINDASRKLDQAIVESQGQPCFENYRRSLSVF